MSGWNRVHGGKFLPPPPGEDAKANVLDRPIGRVDGRSARATGRREQFNPRVHRNFLEGFKDALSEEEKRAGKPVTQGYLLEMMLATWRYERAQGKPAIAPALVLPETIMKAAAGAGGASEGSARGCGERRDRGAHGERGPCEGEGDRQACGLVS